MSQEATAGIGNALLQYLQSIHNLQQESLQKLQQLWKDYVQSVQSSHTEAQDDVADAHRTYVQDLQGALTSSNEQGETVRAYQQFVDALQELQSDSDRETIRTVSDPSGALEALRKIWLDPDRTRKITDAYNAYADAAKRWCNAVQERLTEAHQKYASALSDTLTKDDAAKTAKDAYERYVQGVTSTYRSTAESAQASANDAAEKAESAAKKKSK